MSKKNASSRLAGNDDMAEVYYEDGVVRRKYNRSSSENGKRIFDIVSDIGIHDLGLVGTKISQSAEHLELEHDQITFARPENWTITQFICVCKFTLNLNKKLLSHGLVLKDMLPENVLFLNSKPVFVDFPSIVFLEQMQSLDWLIVARGKEDPRLFVFKKMFIKFMFLPLHIGILNSSSRMHTTLKNKYCNSGNPAPRFRDIHIKHFRRLSDFQIYFVLMFTLFQLRIGTDAEKLERKTLRYLAWLENKWKVSDSSYSSYYTQKNEKYEINSQENWGEKQKNFWAVLHQFKPKTLIDIGANTGWFSILASYMGVDVTSIEVDEPSLDALFQHSQIEGLSITCLVSTFQEIISSKEQDESDSNSRIVFPNSRFDHEGVIAFGLVHHLCLGQGIPVSQIMKTLSSICENFLIIEFVELHDEKIDSEKSFFPKFEVMKSDYSKELFINLGRKYFKYFVEVPSHPKSRSLLIFSKSEAFQRF
jgi:hypothetical protein